MDRPVARLAGACALLLLACPSGAPEDPSGPDPADDDDVADDDDAPRLCNGHAALCDRSFDRVMLPATHNSMSNRDEGWIAPNQNRPIAAQLRDGVRGLLLDTHYHDGDLYLCHSSCLLGSKRLVEGLEEIRDFLDRNPNEVLAIVFQDGIRPEDTARAFEESGLIEHVFTYAGGAWPTLGQMIDAGTRLLVTAEQEGPPPAWHHHAWDLFTETPYSWSSIDAFHCGENRGAADNPLFLLNHWVGNPLSSEDNAQAANAASVLRARIEACRTERGRLPTMVAVDFHDVGALFEVVWDYNEE